MNKSKEKNFENCISSFCVDYRSNANKNTIETKNRNFDKNYFLEDFDPEDVDYNKIENEKDINNEHLLENAKLAQIENETCPTNYLNEHNNLNKKDKPAIFKCIISLLVAFVGVIILAAIISLS